MISDYVKGKKQFDYPVVVQKGIVLHRAIDAFTDAHTATKEAMQVFRPHYRLYAGAFVDVAYDHFLANDTSVFPETAQLQSFAAAVYAALQEDIIMLPEKFAAMLPYMVGQDWLSNYRFAWGIEKSFGGVVRRAAYLTESAVAFDLFNKHLTLLQQCYAAFFPELQKFSVCQLQQLLNH